MTWESNPRWSMGKETSIPDRSGGKHLRLRTALHECQHTLSTCVLLTYWRGITPPRPGDGGHRCALSDEEKRLSACDWNIVQIVRSSNYSEFSVVGNDDCGDAAADPFEGEQVAHTRYP